MLKAPLHPGCSGVGYNKEVFRDPGPRWQEGMSLYTTQPYRDDTRIHTTTLARARPERVNLPAPMNCRLCVYYTA